jgi:CRISPR-associated endoribonuclease Cas6
MRIIFKFTENKTPVPINNQSDINYYVHKCLGDDNKYHDAKNDYSISSLCGGHLTEDKQHLTFENGGFIVVTSKNEEFLNTLIAGVMSNRTLKWGMEFKTPDFIKEDFINGWNHFRTLSPFIIKKYVDKKTYSFVTIDDEDFVDLVKTHTVNKLKKIYDGINLDDFDVRINKHPSHKVKKVMVKNVINKANQCHISFFCPSHVAEKIYNLGVGQSTGSGFGTIYKTENKNKYVIGLKK